MTGKISDIALSTTTLTPSHRLEVENPSGFSEKCSSGLLSFERTAMCGDKRTEYHISALLNTTTRETYTHTVTDLEGDWDESVTTLFDYTYLVTIVASGVGSIFNIGYPVPHGRSVGDHIIISGCAETGFNLEKLVTVVLDDMTLQIDYGGAALPAPGGTPKAQARGTVFNSFDPVFRYSAPRETLRVLGYDWHRASNVINGSAQNYAFGDASVPYEVEFMLDDDRVELVMSATGIFDVYVDGNLLTLGGFGSYAGYPLNFHKFVFSKRKVRHIKVFCDAGKFGGAASRHKNGISPVVSPRRLRMVLIGDSFGEGTGAGTIVPEYSLTAPVQSRKYGYGWLLAQRFNCDFFTCSVGSTGINTNGGGAFGKTKYIDRLWELVATRPDIVMVQNSINSSFPLAQSDCEALFDAIAVVAPNARILGLGRVWVNPTSPPNSVTDDQTFRSACVKKGVPYIDGGIGVAGSVWLTTDNFYTYYNGVQATATATVSGGALTGATVTAAGQGYEFFMLPEPTISGGGGTGGLLHAVWNAEVTAMQVLDGGFGYTVAPTVVIDNGATATVNKPGYTDQVAGINITNPGSGYTKPPKITFSGGGGTGVAATAIIEGGRVIAIKVTNSGTGYTSAPIATFSTSTTNATATATISGGKVTGITIVSKGSFYTNIPRVKLISDSSGGQGAVAVAHLSCKLNSFTVTAAGSGYTSAPTIGLNHPTSGDPTHPKNMGHALIAEYYGYGIDKILN